MTKGAFLPSPPPDCTSIGGVYQGDGSTCLDDCRFGDFDDGGTVDRDPFIDVVATSREPDEDADNVYQRLEPPRIGE